MFGGGWAGTKRSGAVAPKKSNWLFLGLVAGAVYLFTRKRKRLKMIVITEDNKHQFEKQSFVILTATLSEGYVITNKTKMDETKDKLYMVFCRWYLIHFIGAFISYKALTQNRGG